MFFILEFIEMLYYSMTNEHRLDIASSVIINNFIFYKLSPEISYSVVNQKALI